MRRDLRSLFWLYLRKLLFWIITLCASECITLSQFASLQRNSVGKTKRNGNLVPRSYLEISRERSGYETSEMVSAEYESDLRSNEHYLNSSENKTWKKKSRPARDLNPWPLRYRYSALPTELTSQLGTGYYVVSIKSMNWWINDCEYMKVIYLNCG